MSTITVHGFVWQKQQTDCSECYTCRDTIVTDMNVVCAKTEDENGFHTMESDIKMCSSCKDQVNDTWLKQLFVDDE